MKYILFFLLSLNTFAADSRICSTQDSILRSSSGRIIRSTSVLKDFQKEHPCPSTGLTTGACAGWAIDHVIPLACGGCDKMENLQWLPNSIKSASGTYPKDRWERKINCSPMILVK